MKRKKFQPFALVCLGLATVCLASCSSQDSNGVTKELKYVEGSLDKTTYKVGETLDLTGLEVKLFTTTNGVTDNGIIYTNFETSVQEGYKFTEDDVTEEGEYFKVVISAKDDNVATTSFDLTIVSDTQYR